MKDSTETAMEALDKLTHKEVFTPDQVVNLWRYQFGPWDPDFPAMHPFTCGNRDNHPDMAGDKGVLVPTVRGWICPFCDYTQDWAHGFMKGV